MTLRLDGETRILRDILIGEVWLAGGPTNMEALLKDMAADPGMEKDIPRCAASPCPTPRRPICPKSGGPAPGEAAQDMTAVGYAFARCLHETLAVPVGIVSCNQGASRVESWTDPALLEEAGLRLPPEDTHEDEKVFAFNPPGYLYENMLLKVAPYGHPRRDLVPGGEQSGLPEADGYAARFLLMEQNWRRLWDNSRLPFLTVQLAPFGDVPHHGVETWPILREQQLAAADARPLHRHGHHRRRGGPDRYPSPPQVAGGACGCPWPPGRWYTASGWNTAAPSSGRCGWKAAGRRCGSITRTAACGWMSP